MSLDAAEARRPDLLDPAIARVERYWRVREDLLKTLIGACSEFSVDHVCNGGQIRLDLYDLLAVQCPALDHLSSSLEPPTQRVLGLVHQVDEARRRIARYCGACEPRKELERILTRLERSSPVQASTPRTAPDVPEDGTLTPVGRENGDDATDGAGRVYDVDGASLTFEGS